MQHLKKRGDRGKREFEYKKSGNCDQNVVTVSEWEKTDGRKMCERTREGKQSR